MPNQYGLIEHAAPLPIPANLFRVVVKFCDPSTAQNLRASNKALACAIRKQDVAWVEACQIRHLKGDDYCCLWAIRKWQPEILRALPASARKQHAAPLLLGGAEHGHTEAIDWALDGGDGITDCDVHLALECAVRNDRVAAVEQLMTAGFAICTHQLLYCAATHGRIKIVKLLLDQGLLLRDDISRALCGAAKKGHTDIVRLLLQAGVDLQSELLRVHESAITYGNTKVAPPVLCADCEVQEQAARALPHATQHGQADVVALLLEHMGGLVETTTDTGLRAASSAGHFHVVKALIEAGVGVAEKELAFREAAGAGHGKIVKWLLESGEIDEEVKEMALQDAAEAEHVEIVKVITKDVVSDETISSVLTTAATTGQVDIVTALLEATTNTDIKGVALQTAVAANQSKVVDAILTNRESVNQTDGDEALFTAAGNNNLYIAERLVEAGTSPRAQGMALEHAAAWGHYEICRMLLLSLVKLTVIDGGRDIVGQEDRDLALRYAAYNGHKDVIKLLCEFGAKSLGVALRDAAERGDAGVAGTLLNTDDGLVWYISMLEQETALGIAVRNGHWNVAKVIVDAGVSGSGHGLVLQYAAACGHLEMVRQVLSGSGFVVSQADREAAVGFAARYEQEGALRVLFDWGMCTSGVVGMALQDAVVGGWEGVVRFLLGVGVVDRAVRDAAIWEAMKARNVGVLRLLLEDRERDGGDATNRPLPHSVIAMAL
ncbi:hypothetical protein HDV00_008208 [Rhizophlyctis rosea]|nr:hypothetical protein HDV00_008208 [Rhizophlyctis rosea]